MSVEKDPKDGIAHVKGCYVWRIMRITRDVGTQANWVEAIKAEYPHLTREDITEAFAYDGMNRAEIEAHIKHSYELDGTAHRLRQRHERRLSETLKALDLVREAVIKLKMQGAEPGVIFLGSKFRWHLMPHSIADALGQPFDPDESNDHLFGVPVIRVGEQTFVISEPKYSACVFPEDTLLSPREVMEMGK